MALTLEKVAELAGVSRSTVSRVINHQANVKPDVRDRVWQVIKETGYQPNPAARKLAGHKSSIMGLVIPETTQILFNDPYFARLIQGVTQACNAYDYTLSLFLFHTEADEQKLTSRIIGNPLLDGIIIVATSIHDPFVPELQKANMPFVQIGQMSDSDLHFVDTDNQAGAYTAVDHLIQLNCQHIAMIIGPQDNQAAVERKNGYLNALQDRGRFINPNLIVEGDFTEESGYQAMMALLPHQPDGVFVASDTMALGALRALRETATAVPDQVALVGYDDLPLSEQTNPPLTTVRQPIKRLGIVAVEMLLDILENGPTPTRRIIMPNELVIRASCGTAKKET